MWSVNTFNLLGFRAGSYIIVISYIRINRSNDILREEKSKAQL